MRIFHFAFMSFYIAPKTFITWFSEWQPTTWHTVQKKIKTKLKTTHNGKETKKSERTLCGDKIFSYCYTDSIFSPYNARFAQACLNARVSFPHLYIYIIFYIYNFFYAVWMKWWCWWRLWWTQIEAFPTKWFTTAYHKNNPQCIHLAYSVRRFGLRSFPVQFMARMRSTNKADKYNWKKRRAVTCNALQISARLQVFRCTLDKLINHLW